MSTGGSRTLTHENGALSHAGHAMLWLSPSAGRVDHIRSSPCAKLLCGRTYFICSRAVFHEHSAQREGAWQRYLPALKPGHVPVWPPVDVTTRHAVPCRYVNHSVASQHKYTHFMSSGMPGAHMPLAEQRSYKYTLNTDGYATSGRFTKLLATGQVRVAWHVDSECSTDLRAAVTAGLL